MSTTTTKLEIFTCEQAHVNPIFSGAVILLATLFCIYSISTKKSMSSDFTPPKFEDFVPLGYVVECVRLSEQQMSELISSIQSFEKKALAVIAGAGALIGFVSTKEWCSDITTYVAGISILSGICAIFSAGFVITTVDVGLGGANPNYTINHYYNHLRDLFKMIRDKDEKQQAEISYLLLMVLQDYENAIQKTRQVSEDKANKFTCATNFLLVASCSAFAWLLIKLAVVDFQL